MAYLAAYGGPRTEQSHASIDGSLWAPLHQPLFLALFLVAFASNVGMWLQNVAAAWLMTSLAPNALMVGLVQTLSGLPVFLFIIPAGALADLIDRRRLLLFAQGWMLGAAALLGVLTVEGLVTPWILLSLTFVHGAIFWGLFSDAAKPARYVEYFMVESWFEHLRQHGRATDEDSPAFQRARQFHLGPTPPIVSHHIAAGGS